MKICSKCFIEKTESEYFVKDKKTNRLHAQCKACYKEHRKTYYAEHYEKYKHLYHKRALIYREKRRREFRENLVNYLKDKQCTLCAEADMRTLEFDHIDPETKLFSISQAVKLGYSWQAVESEIKKCGLILKYCCHNHRQIHSNLVIKTDSVSLSVSLFL